jgi:hydrogenase expression/formation protein HypC
MCLAIPGRVTEAVRENGVLMGKVDFSGIFRRICLDLVPDVAPGDYVLVHVGFALARIDESRAAELWQALEDLGQLGELEVRWP